MKKRTVAFRANATNVFFHILTRCNLSCRHCYINYDQHGRQTLPLETIATWLELFAGRTAEANVIFLGGEPTLHPELPGAIRTARRLGYRSITVDTNGYLFGDILEKVTPEEVDFFSFSLDGATPAANDRLRGKGCYEHCRQGIQRARQKGFATSLIYTVSNANFDELEHVPALVAELGVERFFIQVIGLRGRSRSAEGLQVPYERWLGAVPVVAERVARQGVTVTYPKVYLEPGEAFECAGIVAQNYFIFPNGRVYRCPLCEDYPLHSLSIAQNRLLPAPPINEQQLFELTIPEGCVMNRLIQPANIVYRADGSPAHRIACCMLKEEIRCE
jgi:MoaA/NifB/PqqE/SkfB family radical SAM enzyme